MSTSFKSKIKKGAGLGTKIGYPTMNFDYDGELRGVFVGRVNLDDWHPAAIHIGPRSIQSDPTIVCEAHVLDWKGELDEGQEIEMEILMKIRDSETFNDIPHLLEMIKSDIFVVRSYFNRTSTEK